MSMRYAIVLFLLFLAAGCTLPTPITDVRLAQPVPIQLDLLPALEDADITQVSRSAGQQRFAFTPVSADTAMRLEFAGLRHMNWPGRESTRQPSSRIFLSDNIYAPVQRVAVGERVFYFLAAATSQIRPDSPDFPDFERLPAVPFVMLALEEGTTSPVAAFVSEGAPYRDRRALRPSVSRNFAVVPWANGLAVIYPDRGGILARRLDISGPAPVFAQQAWQVMPAPTNRRLGLEVVARADTAGHVHVLWSGQDHNDRNALHYCRLNAGSETRCSDYKVLARNDAYPYNLMVQDNRVYATWRDQRERFRYWDTVVTWGRLLINVSPNGGRDFSMPLAINEPVELSGKAEDAVTIPADGGILAWWRVDSRWYGAWLDANLENVQLATTPTSDLEFSNRLEQIILHYHETMGHRP